MSEPKDEPRRWVIVLTIVGIFILWGICWWATTKFMPDEKDEKWEAIGSFGDMFGSVNALFSGAALAGIIYAIILQRRELQLQRHELELTRNELQRSAEAQEKSEAALREQIKQMQEQSELQLLPFVVMVYYEGENPYTDPSRFVLWNAGNGTAINIQAGLVKYNADEWSIIPFDARISILTKDRTNDISSWNENAYDDREIYIEFSNVNNKRYFTRGKFQKGKMEITEFGPVDALHALKRYPQPA